MNQTYTSSDLEHMGVRGMKWGVRRAARKTAKLEKTVTKNIRRYDKGYSIERSKVERLSSKVRTQKYSLTRKVKRANRFLKKASKADAKQVINRFNRDPAKREAVEKYIKALESNYPSLSELRLALIDVRI